MIPGLMAAMAIVFAIRHTTTPISSTANRSASGSALSSTDGWAG